MQDPLRLSEQAVVRFFRDDDGAAYTDITASETPRATPAAALPGTSIDLSGLLV